MKYLQVRLEESLWKRIAFRALDDGVRMSELVRNALLKEFGGPEWGAAVKSVLNKPGGSPEPENDVRVVRDNVGSRPTPGISVVDQKHVSVEFKTCLKCKGKVAVADAERTRDGKYLCRDCADDLRIANA